MEKPEERHVMAFLDERQKERSRVDAVSDESLVGREAALRGDFLNDATELLEGHAGCTDADSLVEAFPGTGDQVEVLLGDGVADGICFRQSRWLVSMANTGSRTAYT